MIRKTRIMLELSLTFDNDTDMNDVTNEIGLLPSQISKKKSDRKNPFYQVEKKPLGWPNGEYMPAYWTIKTEYLETELLDDAFNDLYDKIYFHLEAIRNALGKYDGDAHFCVVPDIYRKHTPSLCFSRKFLDTIEFLKATAEIDLCL